MIFTIENQAGEFNGALLAEITGTDLIVRDTSVVGPVVGRTGVETHGNDIITGGEGSDRMYGEGGDDTFIISSAKDGKGDIIEGGNGPDETTDYDVLDLRGAGFVTIDEVEDETDEGAIAGRVTFSDGSTLDFSQIEEILADKPELTIAPAPGTVVDAEGNPVVTENGQPVNALVISRTGPKDEPLVVSLSSDDTSEANVPSTVTIPAGEASVIVPVTPVDDDIEDGTQYPLVTADAEGFDPVTQAVAVSDNDCDNQEPTFINARDGMNVYMPENTTFVKDLDAVDPDCDTLTFSVAGGADESRFTIDPSTGVLSFIDAPDYEGENSNTGDDDIYDVQVRVEDGKGGSDLVSLNVHVTDVYDSSNSHCGIESNHQHMHHGGAFDHYKEEDTYSHCDIESNHQHMHHEGTSGHSKEKDTYVLVGCVSDYDVKLDHHGDVVFTDRDGCCSTVNGYDYVHIRGDGETYSMKDVISYAGQTAEDDNGLSQEESCGSHNDRYREELHHDECGLYDNHHAFEKADHEMIHHEDVDHHNTSHFGMGAHEEDCKPHRMDENADFMDLIRASDIDNQDSGCSTYGSSDHDQVMG